MLLDPLATANHVWILRVRLRSLCWTRTSHHLHSTWARHSVKGKKKWRNVPKCQGRERSGIVEIVQENWGRVQKHPALDRPSPGHNHTEVVWQSSVLAQESLGFRSKHQSQFKREQETVDCSVLSFEACCPHDAYHDVQMAPVSMFPPWKRRISPSCGIKFEGGMGAIGT